MTKTKRLTQAEFDAIRPHLDNFEAKNIEAVRRILVGGVLQKDIAAEMKMTKEAVSALVGRAWQHHIERGALPEGWQKVQMALPPDLAEVARTLGDVARRRVAK